MLANKTLIFVLVTATENSGIQFKRPVSKGAVGVFANFARQVSEVGRKNSLEPLEDEAPPLKVKEVDIEMQKFENDQQMANAAAVTFQEEFERNRAGFYRESSVPCPMYVWLCNTRVLPFFSAC